MRDNATPHGFVDERVGDSALQQRSQPALERRPERRRDVRSPYPQDLTLRSLAKRSPEIPAMIVRVTEVVRNQRQARGLPDRLIVPIHEE